ncbi:MAG: DUF1292 domain-containing protein [Eubacterium sp.]|nr:DUF1292 domain-containing protein [Eubacterium sp.]
MNTEDTMFTIRDENGNEVGCEYFDTIEYDGKEFVVLLLKKDGEGEVVFMHVESDRRFEPIRDQETLSAVFGIFREKWADEFAFDD